MTEIKPFKDNCPECGSSKIKLLEEINETQAFECLECGRGF